LLGSESYYLFPLKQGWRPATCTWQSSLSLPPFYYRTHAPCSACIAGLAYSLSFWGHHSMEFPPQPPTKTRFRVRLGCKIRFWDRESLQFFSCFDFSTRSVACRLLAKAHGKLGQTAGNALIFPIIKVKKNIV